MATAGGAAMNDRRLERLGAYAGITGALLVASNTGQEFPGFVLFTISSIALLALFLRRGLRHVATQEAVFLLVNVMGMVRWF